ncbi:uncharacterized protein LOC125233240 isoform X10 [Leguminivora glycinivorella]|uniref:uncharacterized protein LOC125233240 isoform X10 n=1 Tax=Leguminivora glycinivorella TaxID=1035111 RepID=UPI00200E3B0B|nr:uncharacterized protein LOC125233240 isoform X10 [Leguminivora glycinivorella]
MSLKAAKVQLKTRYLMLTDYAGTIVVRPGTIAATVARRHFREAYKTYVSAYESLVASDSELAEEERLLYQQQFSEKLPLRVKTLFEERHGTDPQVLPTLTQLVSLLDEQCRVQQAISPAAVERTPAARRSPTARGRGGAAPAHHLAAPRVLAAQPEPNDQACRLRNQQLQRLCTECKISHRLSQPRGGDHHRSGGHHLDRPRHRREGRSRPTHHNHAHHYRGVWRKLGLPPYQTRHLFWWLLVTFHACRLERGPARRRRPSTPCALALDAALSPGNEMISLLVNQRHGG